MKLDFRALSNLYILSKSVHLDIRNLKILELLNIGGPRRRSCPPITRTIPDRSNWSVFFSLSHKFELSYSSRGAPSHEMCLIHGRQPGTVLYLRLLRLFFFSPVQNLSLQKLSCPVLHRIQAYTKHTNTPSKRLTNMPPNLVFYNKIEEQVKEWLTRYCTRFRASSISAICNTGYPVSSQIIKHIAISTNSSCPISGHECWHTQESHNQMYKDRFSHVWLLNIWIV